MVARDRGVGSDDFFRCAICLLDVRGDGDVLADGKAEDGCFGRELESVSASLR